MADPTNGYSTGTIVGLAANTPSFPQMNEQEQFLWNIHRQNSLGGGVDVPGGGKGSVYAGTHEIDGRHYVLPSIWNGQVITDAKKIIENAEKLGLDKFPNYATEDEAERRYQELHQLMEQDAAPVRQPEEAPVNPLRQKFLERMTRLGVK